MQIQQHSLQGAKLGSDANAAVAFDLSFLIEASRRQAVYILAPTVVFASIALTYLQFTNPSYTSSSQVIVDTAASRGLQRQDTTDSGPIDTGLVDSQLAIITSSDLAISIVRQLGLANDSEFTTSGESLLGHLLSPIRSVMKGFRATVRSQTAPAEDLERTAADSFASKLSASRLGLTYVLSVSFTSTDPDKAARIANATADAYIKSVLDAKYSSTRRASQWLDDSLVSIKRQANDAERALQEFKSSHSIVDTGRGLLNEAQLGELSASLASARAQVAEAGARLKRAREVADQPIGSGSVSDAVSNPVILRLRSQYLDLAAKANELAGRFGDKHGAVIQMRTQMSQTQGAVQDELRHMAEGYESDYRIAQARLSSLQASLGQLVAQNDTSNLDKVRLRELEGAAESYRALYNGYLQRSQEITQRESFPVADARIISRALPIYRPSSPKTVPVLGAGIALGVMFGLFWAFLRESADTFASPSEIELFTGLACLGILPRVSRPPSTPAGDGCSEPADDMVLRAPFSRFTESLRSVRITLDGAFGGKSAPILAVSSSLPSEGKTTVALNLAQLIAHAGRRVLLIDADLSSASLSRRTAARVDRGLSQALVDPTELSRLVMSRGSDNLHILSCLSSSQIDDRADLLSSARMAQLLKHACGCYDYVIVDLAPILPVADVKAFCRLVDHILFVVRYDTTSRRAVAEALSNPAVSKKALGVVMNDFDPRALARIEAYRGKSAGSYYLE